MVALSCLIFYSFGQKKPELLYSLDNQIINAMFRWRGTTGTTSQVLIVDIDEKSLRMIGQWPWPRDVVAGLVKAISDAEAKVMGFDIVFAEKDRTSPRCYLKEISECLGEEYVTEITTRLEAEKDLDHDLVLGDAVAQAEVVLGYVFTLKNDGLKNTHERPFPSIELGISPDGIGYEDLAIRKGYRAVLNTEEISQATTEGFFNVFPDPAGTIRKAPLFMSLDGIPYPSIVFEMVRLGLGEPPATIHASSRKKMKKNSMLGISLGGRFIPTDDMGQLTINYRGPVGTFSYISAVDVLDGNDLEQLKDRYVVIGSSASGLLDFHATPYNRIFPGIEVQATIIDNILSGDPLTHDIYTEIGLTYTMIILGGIVLSALLAYTGALAGGLWGILFILSLIVGNYRLFFLNNQLLGIVYPLISIVNIFMVVTLFNYFFEYRKKKFIHDAFSHYVSPVVVNQLMKRPEGLSLVGEQKNLSILFSDIRGFTTISENMEPEQIGRFMNTYLTQMSDIIMEHDGMVDKYIGDAVLAIWGAPMTDDDHMIKAVRSALAMIRSLKALRPVWTDRGLPAIDIGIGINTGIVSVGNFGSDRRFEYTVIGDNVNLASRLEGLNKAYGTNILISGFTRQALDGTIFCRLIDKVRVKGKALPVEIYEPLTEGLPGPELTEEVKSFERAIGLYQSQRFEDAYAIIHALRARNPIPLYDLYIDRINTFKVTPPPEDWDGAFTFTTK